MIRERGCGMVLYEIRGDDLKALMNHLLKNSTFDKFQVRGVEVCTYTKMSLSGIIEKSYYPESERKGISRNYCLWSELREYVFEWIRGERQPKIIKIIFSLDEEVMSGIHANAAAMFLNLNFEEGIVKFTTATAQKNFEMDKSLDNSWDDMVRKFFQKHFPGVNPT